MQQYLIKQAKNGIISEKISQFSNFQSNCNYNLL